MLKLPIKEHTALLRGGPALLEVIVSSKPILQLSGYLDSSEVEVGTKSNGTVCGDVYMVVYLIWCNRGHIEYNEAER